MSGGLYYGWIVVAALFLVLLALLTWVGRRRAGSFG